MDHHRRPHTGRGLRQTLLGVLALLVAATGLLVTPLPAKAEDSTQVLLLLDVSGSMNERISSGGTKFAAAQRAVKRVANAVPAGTQVGLRVYGSEIAEPKEQNPKACTDTKLVLPIGPLNRRQLSRAVDSFEAKGETPIAYSLGKAVDDLGPSGKRVLILISDGEESCDGDPCPAARRLAKAGVDLQFNAIGLAVNSKARSQLQCIAKAGDGNYYDANNTSDLEDAVRRITQRALRPFQTSGTPVEGTVDQAGAPSIRVGQYKDSYDASNTPRYYRVTRTPGSTVTASISTIVRPYPSQNTENWTLTLATPDGTPCATATATSGGYRATTVLSGAVVSSQVDPITRSPAPEPCASAPELLLSLARSSPLGNEDEVSVEVLIAEEPPISNLADLPEPDADYTGTAGAVRAATPSPSRLGGTSFSNSTEVKPGTWRDSVATGETVFYRVRLETGQRLRVTAETPTPRQRLEAGGRRGHHHPGERLLPRASQPDRAVRRPAGQRGGPGHRRLAHGAGAQPRGAAAGELAGAQRDHRRGGRGLLRQPAARPVAGQPLRPGDAGPAQPGRRRPAQRPARVRGAQSHPEPVTHRTYGIRSPRRRIRRPTSRTPGGRRFRGRPRTSCWLEPGFWRSGWWPVPWP